MTNVLIAHTCSNVWKCVLPKVTLRGGMILCCLCQMKLKSDKRKNLHNRACAKERKLLEMFPQSLHEVELLDFEETRGRLLVCTAQVREAERYSGRPGEMSVWSVKEPAHRWTCKGWRVVRKCPPAWRTLSPEALQAQGWFKGAYRFLCNPCGYCKNDRFCKLELFWVSFSFPTPSARGLISARRPSLLLVGICPQCIQQYVQQCRHLCHIMSSVAF